MQQPWDRGSGSSVLPRTFYSLQVGIYWNISISSEQCNDRGNLAVFFIFSRLPKPPGISKLKLTYFYLRLRSIGI